jgi:hypothetical protein
MIRATLRTPLANYRIQTALWIRGRTPRCYAIIMREIFVATPLNSSAGNAEHKFGDDISIRAISPILWETSVSKRYISEDQREKLSEVRYWLVLPANTRRAQTMLATNYMRKPDMLLWLRRSYAPQALSMLFSSSNEYQMAMTK